jgi:ATP-dependent Lon protease
MGTVCSILKMIKQPDGQNSIVVHGLARFRVKQWLTRDPFLRARIEVLAPKLQKSRDLDALVTSIRHSAQRMVELSPNIPDEVNVVLSNIEDPSALADFLAANINISHAEKQSLLETIDVHERLQKLSLTLAEQIELLEMSAKIQQRVSSSIDKSQREYYLQEQLKAIQSELGIADQKAAEIDELRNSITKANMPEKVHEEAIRELNRLAAIPTASPEYSVIRNYIEWLTELPWNASTHDVLNINSARRILNRDHYNLAKVKKRILEFLAVRKLNPTGRSPILCFSGPPGVGKTSLGRSIAAAMGRKFIRISLGGMHDEADIRGHRRTYIGALPGRIIQELRKCGAKNPVFMLDELDKVGKDFRGDPAAALLEVLDPEQNSTFTDNYIDQPFDLSRVLFIGTVNYMAPVPPALRDRMEVIEIPGYTVRDKLEIAKKYLVPRQISENGLKPNQITIREDAVQTIIDSYTREAGVRNLDRELAALCRGVAAEVASGTRRSATINAYSVPKFLGPKRFESELALRTSVPGVATGLAYTPVGGEILFVEANSAPGTGKLILTGQLGDVMRESAQAALSVIKGQALAARKAKPASNTLALLALKLEELKYLAKLDIHVHVPAGAIPKDGPSAGVAMYIALASLFLDLPVHHDVAMTGEITLRGLVLPIGGLKEKLLAAKAAGIKTVILPHRNQKDLEDVPPDAKKALHTKFVKNLDQALKIALS